jgi:hypothetical protein
VAQQALGLVRVLATAALTVVLVLGPGLALRAGHCRRCMGLGFVPLPGLAVLIVTGCVAWALAGRIDPRVVCVLMLAPVLGWLLVGVVRAGREEILSSDERRALLIVAAALGVAIARTLWSLAPPGELYAGTSFRTLEVGDRSDSTISFHVVQLVAHGTSPFGSLARGYFVPYTFSDRGPLAGVASAPVVLLSGGRPPVAVGSTTWSPFDAQGFMSYRLAMMIFASTAFLSLWTLTRRLAGERAARLALLLAVTTPFLVHEVWFTWPKLLAASLVILSAASVIAGRPLVAGLLVGAGYLVHPIALLSVPVLCLLALWPLGEARASHPPGTRVPRLFGVRVPRPRVRPALLLLAGVAANLLAWRIVNWSHYTQSNFLESVSQAGRTKFLNDQLVKALGGHPAPVALSAWLSDRLVSVGNTLVPLRLVFFSAHDRAINAINPACSPFCSGSSPAVVHFFFQYWTTVPFGFAIAFLPLLLQSMWRATRRWPWPVTAAVIVPFLMFAVYWGGDSTGLLREGLQTWVLTVLVVVALEQQREHFGWLRHAPVRALLALRSVEVLLVAMLPAIVTRHRVYGTQFWLTDIVAAAALIIFSGCLGMLIWRERVPLSRSSTSPSPRGSAAPQK